MTNVSTESTEKIFPRSICSASFSNFQTLTSISDARRGNLFLDARFGDATCLERLTKRETASATATFHRDGFLAFALLFAAAFALVFDGAADGAGNVAE